MTTSSSQALGQDAHRRLELLNSITSLGDFLSLFAVISATHRLSGSVAVAAYAVPLQALALSVAGATFPWLSGKAAPRGILIATQTVSGFIMLGLLWLLWRGGPVPAILALYFAQALLKQYFTGAREAYSKASGSASDQRGLQANLLHGLYQAQLVGPLLSLFLIRWFGEQMPILLDAISFFLAAAVCWTIPEIPAPPQPSLLRPLSYLWSRPALLQIFAIRSILYWIPTGIFNYVVFSVVSDHFGLQVVDSAWTYSAIGLGSLVGTTWFRHAKKIADRAGWIGAIARLPDAHAAFVALLFMSITRISFIHVPTLPIALGILALGGISNGLNAVATQAIRRRLTDDREFPEILGLEIVVGRAADWVVASLCFGGLLGARLTYEQGIWASALGLFALAWLHLTRALKGA